MFTAINWQSSRLGYVEGMICQWPAISDMVTTGHIYEAHPKFRDHMELQHFSTVEGQCGGTNRVNHPMDICRRTFDCDLPKNA